MSLLETREANSRALEAAKNGAKLAKAAYVALRDAPSRPTWNVIRGAVDQTQTGFEMIKPLLFLSDADIDDAISRDALYEGFTATTLKAAILEAQTAGATVTAAIVAAPVVKPSVTFSTETGRFEDNRNPTTPDADIADAVALLPAAIAAIDAALGG